MKRVFIVHRWDGTPEADWYPWLVDALRADGFSVSVLQMPDTESPVIAKWVAELARRVARPDTETYFVGHSMGCQTILRYLLTFEMSVLAGGAVFVAGWFKLANLEDEEVEAVARPWLEMPAGLEKIKRIFGGKLTVLLSSNDPYGCVPENKGIFEKKLGAKVIILEGRGHFTATDGVLELPEVLDALREISNRND